MTKGISEALDYLYCSLVTQWKVMWGCCDIARF